MNLSTKSKIKVLHFSIANRIGGIETFIKSLVDNIDIEKFEIGIVANTPDYPFRDFFQEKKVKVNVVSSPKKLFKYYSELRNIISSYDIIHFHKNSATNIIPHLIAHRLGKKIITHSHNTMPSHGSLSNILHKIFRKKLNKMTDVRLACGDLAGKWMFGSRSFKIIKNGIDLEKFSFSLEKRKQAREEFGYKDTDFVLGHVGRFNLQKNHQFLVKVFSELYAKNHSFKLILIGDGNLKGDIIKLAKDLKCYEAINFIGQTTEIFKFYNLMDLFVFPSIYEGLPISLVEVAANGLPAIISDKITREVILTENVAQLPIDDLNIWVTDIIKNVKMFKRVNNSLEVVKEAGYSAKDSISEIEQIYFELGGDICEK